MNFEHMYTRVWDTNKVQKYVDENLDSSYITNNLTVLLTELFTQLCCDGNLESIKYIVEKFESIFQELPIERGILFASSNDLEIVKYLVSKGVDLKSLDTIAFNHAIGSNKTDVIDYFIEQGMKPDDSNLHYCIMSNNMNLFYYLYQFKKDFSLKYNSLEISMQTCSIEMLCCILNHPIHFNIDRIHSKERKHFIKEYQKYKKIMSDCIAQIHGDPNLERTKTEQLEEFIHFNTDTISARCAE